MASRQCYFNQVAVPEHVDQTLVALSRRLSTWLTQPSGTRRLALPVGMRWARERRSVRGVVRLRGHVTRRPPAPPATPHF